jgi:hypothetical protein
LAGNLDFLRQNWYSALAMFTKISSITLAILMFLMLLGSQSHLYVLAGSVVVLIFAAFAINFKRLNFSWPHLLLPSIYLIGAAGVFAIIPSTIIRISFLFLASVLFYLLEVKLGKESHFLQNIYLLSVFAIYLGMFALQFYFNLQIWYLVPLSFIVTYFLAVQGLAGFSLPAKKYFYLLIALIAAEATWGMAFWPTHYFVNSVILFCIFYLLWLFAFSAFFGKLSRAKIYWQLTLIAIVVIVTLSTAAWRPLR